MEKDGLSWKKMTSFTTVGARALTGIHNEIAQRKGHRAAFGNAMSTAEYVSETVEIF